ncbi:hypothetical protein [Moraxella sp. RCAD0137]|uniref:hypothetical protein n=1 Tax=Moraxella sp. RCAD0137 TaxID=1775913 RepID=UPI0013049A09|nr:hypothetical protein [Moraxella sp. RCAD0137]
MPVLTSAVFGGTGRFFWGSVGLLVAADCLADRLLGGCAPSMSLTGRGLLAS